MERSALEKSKAEYSNESDLADDALRDVEKAVDQMRNDAISGKSKMSRKEIESIALQLMNVASKVSDLKEKIPDLENQMRKVTHKEHESTKREALFINEEPMRLDDCLERCKALTGTLQTLKEGFLKISIWNIKLSYRHIVSSSYIRLLVCEWRPSKHWTLRTAHHEHLWMIFINFLSKYFLRTSNILNIDGFDVLAIIFWQIEFYLWKLKKKLAGVQEKHRGFDNDTSGGQSLSRSYGRSNSHHDPVRIQKALLAEIENIEVNHERREVVIKEAEPRWAMQRFRNKTYEKAKFEKVWN